MFSVNFETFNLTAITDLRSVANIHYFIWRIYNHHPRCGIGSSENLKIQPQSTCTSGPSTNMIHTSTNLGDSFFYFGMRSKDISLGWQVSSMHLSRSCKILPRRGIYPHTLRIFLVILLSYRELFMKSRYINLGLLHSKKKTKWVHFFLEPIPAGLGIIRTRYHVRYALIRSRVETRQGCLQDPRGSHLSIKLPGSHGCRFERNYTVSDAPRP